MRWSFYHDIFLSHRFIKYLETSCVYLYIHIIYTLNLWESPKSAECDAGYELFLAVFQHRFYFTALPVACARVKVEWVKREKKDAGEARVWVMRERVPFYRAVYLALLHPDAVLKSSVGRRDASRGKNANWEARGRFFHPSWKKRATTLCPLPSAVWRFFTDAPAKTD